jgi:hypothetical protein
MSNDFPWYLTSNFQDEHADLQRDDPWKPAWTAQDLEMHLTKHQESTSEQSFEYSKAALAACLSRYCVANDNGGE